MVNKIKTSLRFIIMRHLTEYERNLVSIIIDAQESNIFDGADIKNILGENIDSNGSLKFFNDESGQQAKFPAEAHYVIDSASSLSVHALLFTKNGKLDELEIYRDDGETVSELPSIHKWTTVSL